MADFKAEVLYGCTILGIVNCKNCRNWMCWNSCKVSV